MTNEVKNKIEAGIILLLPEATQIVKTLKNKVKTTKDNYGYLMQILQPMGKLGGAFTLAACVRAGYPKQTARELCNILGYNRGLVDFA